MSVISLTTTATIGSNATVNATEQITVEADASLGSAVAITLPLVGDVSGMSFAAGGALSNGDVAIGGSVVVEIIAIVTTASIGSGAQVNQTATPGANQSIVVSASDTTEMLDGAGGLGASTGSVGIGAGIVVIVINKDVRASIGANANVKAARDITVEATPSEDLVAFAVSVGASTSAGVSASIIVVVLARRRRRPDHRGVDRRRRHRARRPAT